MTAALAAAAFTAATGQFKFVPREQLVAGDNARKTFDPQRLAELAKTIAEHGIVEPILVRPGKGEKLEIVAGERRWRAAELAKAKEVPVIVRNLSDKQALEIQTIENAQREDLHPLEQAAGYERLIKDFGYTPEKIADAIGKSRAHVFQIRKLLALSPKMREAFIAGDMDTTLATVVARVPGHSMQEAAWKQLKDEFRTGFSFRAAADFIRRNFMLDLMRAPFNINDAQLVAKAGACPACPKRTGNQADLFADVKNGNVCTDPACFNEKRAAATKVEIKQAEDKGREVIVGAAAKKLMPWHGSLAHGVGYVEPTVRCYDDAKERSWRDLAKLAEVEPALIQNPESGRLEPIIPVDKVKRALEAKGIKLIRTRETSKAEQAYRKQRLAAEAKAKRETEARRRAWTEIRGKVRALPARDLATIAGAVWREIWHETRKPIVAAWNWPAAALHRDAPAQIAKLKPAELARLFVDMAIVRELPGNRYSREAPTYLGYFGRRYGVNLDKHRRAVEAEERAKQAAKKKPAAKKPAAKKAAKARKAATKGGRK